MKNILKRTGVGLLLSISFTTGCQTGPSSTPPASTSSTSRLANDMVGTWVHVGSPGRVRPAPEAGGRFKMRDGDHWNLTVVDGDSGLVTENFGGTYTMNGDEYVETQHYATQQWLQDNGKSWRFKVKVEGDTMTQYGLDNPFTEVWTRVK